jgi:Ca2+-binding RTX toxin-like protein
MNGNAGDDTMYGQDGGDLMEGAGGNDTLYGGTGPDELHGGEDDYSGGPPVQFLYCGTGTDRYSLGPLGEVQVDCEVIVR